MPAQTIDEVIDQLNLIITHAVMTGSRSGYFAALYCKVTSRVKEGIQNGEFQDGARMERFDVIFANRYLAAYQQWTAKKPLSSSWNIAFETLEKPAALVLQHLFLGMNAHINLDLGIAAAETAKAANEPLTALHNDLNIINTILAALTYEVVNDLDQVSPLLSLAGLHSKNDSLFIQFEMNNARDGAWCFAEELFNKENADYITCINERDSDIYQLGRSIVECRGLLKITVFVIHLFEYKNPSVIVKVLDGHKKKYMKVNKLSLKN